MCISAKIILVKIHLVAKKLTIFLESKRNSKQQFIFPFNRQNFEQRNTHTHTQSHTHTQTHNQPLLFYSYKNICLHYIHYNQKFSI